jgi:PPOX class probable F420-dependent enzyme
MTDQHQADEHQAAEHEAALTFWEERHLCFLANVRPDGTPHMVPVGATFDPETGVARVITDGASLKARLVERAPDGRARVAVSQVDGARWTTLEGVARVRREPEAVADAVRRYTARYREPRENPTRVVIEIAVDRVLGSMKVPLPGR